MGDPTGFLEYQRHERAYAPVEDRLKHWREFIRPLPDDELRRQGARCMDCGTPFCHHACPVNNIIPDWNDLVYQSDFKTALATLHQTNNFPDFTGRICPAPCEASCTLNLIEQPVTIKTIEHAIVERGWSEGWIEPQLAAHQSGKRVAVIGSGPAGLACAQQLARAGHAVAVFEKSARIGGLLRYGIPDFKLEKFTIDRRIAQMRAEGVEFHPNCHIGVNVPVERLMREFDAVAFTIGSEVPRDLPVPGRELHGIHFAMEFLAQQNRRVAGEKQDESNAILATGRNVLVIGGGDTGSDCIGTSNRHGARSITQIEILPMPPEHEDKLVTWPDWPMKLRTSSSHEEGVERDWSVSTKGFTGRDGRVTGLDAMARVEMARRRRTAGWSCTRSPAAPSTSRSIWCCWRWASSIPSGRARSRSSISRSIRAAISRPIPTITAPRSTRCSRRATRGAASRSSSGRSAKGGNAPARSTNI